MSKMSALALVILASVASFAFGFEVSQTAVAKESPKTVDNSLEKTLWDADLQWLCNYPDSLYYKKGRACVQFRSAYWTDQFFEVSDKGQVRTKAQMIAQQSDPRWVGVTPYPDQFKLMAVYGDFALATDHTVLKTRDARGKPVSVDTRVIRMFAKEKGQWRPAGASLTPILAN